jgi:hypothetical protein
MNNIPIKLENTLDALEQAIKVFKPEYLRPYLELDNVFIEPNKDDFYTYFRYMLRTTKKITEGNLKLKIKPSEDSETSNYYEFYDDMHLHPRITFIVEQSEKGIHLDILPF